MNRFDDGPNRDPGLGVTDRETRDLDRILFRSELVTVGAFRADPDHPRFHDSGPIEQPVFVFPRTSVVIRHEGRPPFATDTRTVTYYNEGQRYTRRKIDPRGDLCEWFSLRPNVLRDVLSDHDPAVLDREGRIFPFTRGTSDRRSYMLQRLLVRHLNESRAVDPLVVEELVIDLLREIAGLVYERRDSEIRDGRNGTSPRNGAVLARQAREYLLERFTDSFTLDEVADAVGASVYHLCRVFKREVETTIHRYRSDLRLRHSLELVAESNDLSSVAFRLGYSSHSHFTASFGRAFSITPSDFRRKASSRRIRELRASLDDR